MLIKPKKYEKDLPVWSLEKDGLTQGALGVFMTCPEKFRLAIQMGYRKKYQSWNTAISFGSAFHEVMANTVEQVRNYTPQRRTAAALIDIMEEEITDYSAKMEAKIMAGTGLSKQSDLNSLEKELKICKVMLGHYFRNWENDWKSLEWIALEKEFLIPVEVGGSKLVLRGKMDGVYRLNGDVWLFETKTKSRIDDAAITDKLPFEMQVLLYMHGIFCTFGEMPMGVLYNLVRRPQLRQKTSESDDDFCERIDADVMERPDFYLKRYEAAITKEEMQRWLTEFVSLLGMFVQWEKGEFHYRNSNACQQNWGTCDYLPICSRNSPGDWAMFEQEKTVFTELAPLIQFVMGEE